MDTLRAKGVKAVFFVTGDFMNDRPDLVRRIVNEGHRVGNHSYAHLNQLGYKTLMWGAAYKDWDTSAQPTRDAAMTLLRQYTTPGDIILLHGVSQTSNDILGQYIDEYRDKGFVFALP